MAVEDRGDDADDIVVKQWQWEMGLANSPRQPQHEHEHLGHRLVKLGRDFIAELDMGERAGQHFVFLDRDVMGFREFDDLLADASPALGDDPRRADLS